VYLDIKELLSKDRRAIVNGVSRTIEGTPKHLNTDRHAQHIACELAMSV
jgi:hypothetical protein